MADTSQIIIVIPDLETLHSTLYIYIYIQSMYIYIQSMYIYIYIYILWTLWVLQSFRSGSRFGSEDRGPLLLLGRGNHPNLLTSWSLGLRA